MKANTKIQNLNGKISDKNLMELAAERLAAILVSQIEFNKTKRKNIYGKNK